MKGVADLHRSLSVLPIASFHFDIDHSAAINDIETCFDRLKFSRQNWGLKQNLASVQASRNLRLPVSTALCCL